MLTAKQFGEIFQGPFQDRTTPFLSPPPSRVSSINNSLSLALALNPQPKPSLSLSFLSFALALSLSRSLSFFLSFSLFRTYEEALRGEEDVEALSFPFPPSLSLTHTLSHTYTHTHLRGSAARRGGCRDGTAPLSGSLSLFRSRSLPLHLSISPPPPLSRSLSFAFYLSFVPTRKR